MNRLKNTVEEYKTTLKLGEEVEVFIDLIEEAGESTEVLEEAQEYLNNFVSRVDSLEIQALLSQKYDTANCIFSINSGAGGTDAQDWAQILFRMYTRWMDHKKFQFEVVDQTLADEAGLKSVTVIVKGEYAYGYLKNEIGIHRLVRLSPFNANNKRHTSFAAVDVVPEISTDIDEIKLDPKDLRIDTYRSTGAGGQHVNKTDSAVRITHLPTGLVSQCQNSRSQIANRETALIILKSRILAVLEKEQKKYIDEIRGISKEIGWGSQIRSYVFHPYKLVKDLRTNLENTNLQAVMDGDLDGFIFANLRNKEKL